MTPWWQRDLVPRNESETKSWQKAMGVKPSGWIGPRTAEAMFEPDRWPEGCFYDFDTGAYFIP